MGVEGCAKCIKYWLFVLNLFVLCAGLTVLGFGIYIKVEYGDFVRLDTETAFDYVHGANILIGAGAFITVVCFFGCYGSFKECKYMLVMYAIFVFIAFVVEVVGGGLAYHYREKLEEDVHSVFNKTLTEEYGQEGNSGLTELADKFMKENECCGTNGYKDWYRSFFSNGKHDVVPNSCCKPEFSKCGTNFTVAEIYERGCWPLFRDMVKEKYDLIGGLGIGIGVLLLHAVILACVFPCCANKSSGTLA